MYSQIRQIKKAFLHIITAISLFFMLATTWITILMILQISSWTGIIIGLIWIIFWYFISKWVDSKNDNAWRRYFRPNSLNEESEFVPVKTDIKRTQQDVLEHPLFQNNRKIIDVERKEIEILNEIEELGKEFISNINNEIGKIDQYLNSNRNSTRIGKDYNVIKVEQLVDRDIGLEGSDE